MSRPPGKMTFLPTKGVTDNFADCHNFAFVNCVTKKYDLIANMPSMYGDIIMLLLHCEP
jgi:hypothetical protein